jgi:hypothetical protein
MKIALLLNGISYCKFYENKSSYCKIDYKDSNIFDFIKKNKMDIFLTTNESEKINEIIEYFNPINYNLKNDIIYTINQNKNVLNNYDIIIISKFNLNFKIKFPFRKYYKNNIYMITKFNLIISPISKLNQIEDYFINKIKFKFIKIKNKIDTIVNKQININDIHSIIMISKKPKKTFMIIDIKNTPHYKFLINDKNDYLKYLQLENKDNHSEEIFNNLINNFDITKIEKITGKIYNNKLIIFDGIHRTSILLNKGIKTIKIKTIKKYSILDKPKYYDIIDNN